MAKKIDWLYARKSCVTCQRAAAYLEGVDAKVVEKVDATKTRYEGTTALAVLEGMDKLVAARGKKVVTLHLKKDRPDDSELLALLKGPTGNLRGPTMKIGKTVLVGFNEDAYKEIIG